MHENYKQFDSQQSGSNQESFASPHPSQVPSTTGQNQLALAQTTPSGKDEVVQAVETWQQFGYPCAGNAYGNFYQLSPEDRSRLVVEDLREHLRGQRRMEEQFSMHQENLRYEVDKQYIKDASAEARRERQRAQSLKFALCADGEVHVITDNTLTTAKKRRAVNFKYPKLFRLQSSSGDTGVFLFQFEINGKEQAVFLDEQKCGNIRYFMKRIRTAGGDFLARKKEDKEELATALWVYLNPTECAVIIVPADIGWMKTADGYRFVKEEELTWEKIMNSLK